MGQINIEIPEELHRHVKSVCALNSLAIQDFVNSAVRSKLISDSPLLNEENMRTVNNPENNLNHDKKNVSHVDVSHDEIYNDKKKNNEQNNKKQMRAKK